MFLESHVRGNTQIVDAVRKVYLAPGAEKNQHGASGHQ